MSRTIKDIFVNLPVKDLEKSKAFFQKMGFVFDENYCDDRGCALVLGEHMYAMLLMEDFFVSFTESQVTDTSESNEVIIAVMMDSPEEMEDAMKAGLEAGGKDRSTPLRPEEEEMLQYYRLEDLDGHLWELSYMDTTNMLP